MLNDGSMYAGAVIEMLSRTFDKALKRHPGLPDGDRIFIRWTDSTDGNQGWDDWRLVALVKGSGLEWIVEHGQRVREPIYWGVFYGDTHGKFTAGTLTVWWSRAILDGPKGGRVSDWASGGEMPGRKNF